MLTTARPQAQEKDAQWGQLKQQSQLARDQQRVQQQQQLLLVQKAERKRKRALAAAEPEEEVYGPSKRTERSRKNPEVALLGILVSRASLFSFFLLYKSYFIHSLSLTLSLSHSLSLALLLACVLA